MRKRWRGKGISLGVIGGLLGTWLMDIIIVLTFLIAGLRWDGFFSMVGDKLGQGTAVGMLLHNIIGLSVGCLFVLVVSNVGVLKIDTRRKGLMFGVLVGAATIPLGCVPLAIWIGEPILDVVAFSTVPHMVYGTVLGLVVTYGLLRGSGPVEGSLEAL